LAAAVAMVLTVLPAAANEVTSPAKPTFYKDVLPILQESCQDCHRPGGKNMGGMVAPMAFMDYKDTRPWAKGIAKAVANREMPPWDASPEHAGVFIGERVLDEGEIETIVKWASTGAARGNQADAPPAREFPVIEGWSIGEPDLIVKMPEPFFVPDDLLDETHYFKTKLTEEQLPKDRWIKKVEFRPGSTAVHHIIATPLGGIAPGNAPLVYRDGYSAKLHAGEEIVFNMHYHKEPGAGTGVWDQSEVAVIFYPEDYTPEHVLQTSPLGTFAIDIPPHEKHYQATAHLTFPDDALINSMMPHMHYRGVEAKYVLTYPDGKEETLLHVPQYDFNWQTSYRFKEPKLVPKGTKVSFTATWDNSDENPNNPDPNQRIHWGEATHEEMMFGWISFTNPHEGADARSGMISEGIQR
jgi:hypothetical protein